MNYDPDKHHRRSIRLKDYDYAQEGAYFVPLCVQDQACLFGDVVGDEMRLSDIGQCVVESWWWLAEQYPYVVLDSWVVMPNHLHGTIVIMDDLIIPGSPVGRLASRPTGARRDAPLQEAPSPQAPKRKPLGQLVGAFKTVSTRRINVLRGTPGAKLWQRNYWERVIRDERELNAIREYVFYNPAQWTADRYHPG